jgi:hypothetical protein
MVVVRMWSAREFNESAANTDRVVCRPLARCTLGGLGGPDAGPEMTGERRETAVRRLCRLSGIRADPG